MRLPTASGDWVFLFKMQSSTYSERICEILPKQGKVEFPFRVDGQKSLPFVQLLTVYSFCLQIRSVAYYVSKCWDEKKSKRLCLHGAYSLEGKGGIIHSEHIGERSHKGKDET